MFALRALAPYRGSVERVERIRPWVPLGLGFLAFGLYALLAPPSVYWLDSGELTAAGAGLGVPHPTGFPLYAALLRIASLIPIGEIAFRANLLSAAMAGVAIFFVCKTVLLVGDGLAGVTGAIASGAVLMLSLLMMRHATVAEVYTPTAALLAPTLYLMVRVGAGADARYGLLLAVLVGLGLGIHGSYRLLVFFPFAVLLIVRLRHGARWPLAVPVVTFTSAAALHAYLPLRSVAAAPGLDWGHPRTLAAMLDHVRAKSIFASFEGEIFATESERFGVAVAGFFETVADSLGPVALVLVVAGLVWFPRQRRLGAWLAGILGCWLLLDALYGAWINPMGLRDLQNGLPFCLAAAVCVGGGVIALSRFAGKLGAPVAAAVAVLAFLPPAVTSFSAIPAATSGDSPLSWSEAILEQAEPRATIFVTNDSTAAPLLYSTAITGARPDVTVLVRQLFPDRERTEALWASSHPGKSAPKSLVAMLESGPALWEPGSSAPPKGFFLVAGAPMLSVSRGRPEGVERRRVLEALDELEVLFGGGDSEDLIARRVQAQALTQLAIHLLRQDRSKEGLSLCSRILDVAVAIDGRNPRALVNRGTVASMRGDLDAAIRDTELAVRHAPNHPVGRINLARFYLAKGQPQRAFVHAERATVVAPDNASSWALAAAAAKGLGKKEEARRFAARARSIDPNNRDLGGVGP